MKRDSLPDSYRKQKKLHDKKVSVEVLVSLGERFLEQGRFFDASLFFRKADHRAGLERLKTLAMEQGDSFLFQLVVAKDSGPANRQEWEALGKKAVELGKFSHAVRAFRAAENEEARKKAEDELDRLRSRPPEPEEIP
jgi:Flp pilus assembly protein TadD